MKKSLSLDDKRELCSVPVTLDGKRAKICGARLRFAVVRQFDGPLELDWSWPAVQRIIAAGGHFKSE